MATLARLNVILDLDQTGFGKGLDGASSKLKSFAGGVLKAARSTAIISTPIVGVGVAAVKFASDLSEAQNQINVVFGDNAKMVNKWAENSAQKFGMAKSDVFEWSGNIGSIFTQAGKQTTEVASNYTESLIGLGADLASFYNSSTEESMAALRSGLTGESEPLKRFGIFLTEDEVKLKALAMGMVDANGEITEQGRILARNALIFEKSKVAHGDFANTSDGLANQMRILKASLKETLATLGAGLLPVVLRFARALNVALGFVQKFIGRFRDMQTRIGTTDAFFKAIRATLRDTFGAKNVRGVNEWVSKIEGAFERVRDVFQSVVDFIGRHKDIIIPAIKGIAIAIAGILAVSGVISIITGIGSALLLLVSPIGLIVLAIALLYVAWTKDLGGIQEKTASAVKWIREAFDMVVAAIEFVIDHWRTFVAALGPVGIAILLLVDHFGAIKAAVIDFATSAIGWIQDNAIPALQSLWDAVSPKLDSLANWFTNVAVPAVRDFYNDSKPYIDDVIGLLDNLWNKVSTTMQGIWDWATNVAIPGIVDFYYEVKDNVGKIKDRFQEIGDKIGEMVQWFVGIKDAAKQNLGDIRDRVEDVFGTFETWFGKVETVWNNVKDVFNELKGILDSIKIPDGLMDLIDKVPFVGSGGGKSGAPNPSMVLGAMEDNQMAREMANPLYLLANVHIPDALRQARTKLDGFRTNLRGDGRLAAIAYRSAFQDDWRQWLGPWIETFLRGIKDVQFKTFENNARTKGGDAAFAFRDEYMLEMGFFAEDLLGFLNQIRDITLFNFVDKARSRGDEAGFAFANAVLNQLVYLRDSGTGLAYSVGYAIGQGVNSGLGAWSSAIVATMIAIVTQAITAAKRILGIASPSRVFMEIGGYAGEGLAIGLDRSGAMVAAAGARMAGAAIPSLAGSGGYAGGHDVHIGSMYVEAADPAAFLAQSNGWARAGARP